MRSALDKAAIKSHKPGGASLTEVEETKAMLSILPLFFWCGCTHALKCMPASSTEGRQL